MHWVWMKSAPAAAFLASRGTRIFSGMGEGVGRRADEHARPAVLDLLAALEEVFVPHFLEHRNELDGVDVVDVLRHRVIAELLVVAGEANEIVDAVGRRAENVGLHGDAVAVPADHLHDGVHALVLDDQGRGERRHADHRGLVVGDVHAVHESLEQPGFLSHDFRIRASRRPALTGDGKMSRSQNLFEIAVRFHSRSSLTCLRGPPSRLVLQSGVSIIFS